jgi:rRNA maturation endonuclease Nob1
MAFPMYLCNECASTMPESELDAGICPFCGSEEVYPLEDFDGSAPAEDSDE